MSFFEVLRPCFRIVSALVLATFFFSSNAFAGKQPQVLSDEALLDLIQRQSFEYFIHESNPETGLVKDKANNFYSGQTISSASIAATGFGLTAFPVGVSRDWIDIGTARERTRRTLEFFLNHAPHQHGFFYHFLDSNTGKRAMRSEVSPIDTALFLAGALMAAEYYEDPVIRDLTEQIYARVDWRWMLNGGKTLALAWSPEQGFSKHRWDHYSELMIMYLLAIGSPTHAIPASSWKEIRRPAGSYADYRVIQQAPLFTHQYSHIWIDFKDKNDGFADYFQNSVNATLANRAFAVEHAKAFKSYGPDSWGLTASDGPGGYRAYGAPPGWSEHDGTVAPTACGGSIVFTPKESIACLRYFYEKKHAELWGNYGFADAFNEDKNWVSKDAYGIDQGPIVLMIENYRTGLIWNTLKKNVYLQEAMKAVGFKPGTVELPWPEPPEHRALYSREVEPDGFLRDWPNGKSIHLDKKFQILGEIKNELDLDAEIRFAWDENALYFYVRASDDAVMSRRTGRNIWQDDLLEVYIDPQGDGLYWKQPEDYQIGFRPNPKDNSVSIWSWFQDEDPMQKEMVTAHAYTHKNGYIMEGAISWEYLDMRPKAGMKLHLSVSIHDIDRDRSDSKLEWFMRNEKQRLRFELGRIVLEDKLTQTVKKEPEKKTDVQKQV